MGLNQEQTRQLRNTVEKRRAEIIEELRNDVERARGDRFRDLAGSAPDAGDESVALLIADLDHAEVGRDVQELRSLEGARARLRDGTYGTCAECGGEIGFERLKVNPAAMRCVDCQRMYEKTHAGTSGSSL